jgi:hypothetical protein
MKKLNFWQILGVVLFIVGLTWVIVEQFKPAAPAPAPTPTRSAKPTTSPATAPATRAARGG